MTAVSLLLAIIGGLVIAAFVAAFVNLLIGIRRRTRSVNLELGVAHAWAVAGGIALVDWGVGWSGEPLMIYALGWLVLPVPFVAVILAIRPR